MLNASERAPEAGGQLFGVCPPIFNLKFYF